MQMQAEKERKKADAQKEEDFEKFLKGEKITITDDMSL